MSSRMRARVPIDPTDASKVGLNSFEVVPGASGGGAIGGPAGGGGLGGKGGGGES